MVVAEKRLNVTDIKSVRNMCAVIHMYRVRNEVQRRTGVTRISW